jgi:hypothetical protein
MGAIAFTAENYLYADRNETRTFDAARRCDKLGSKEPAMLVLAITLALAAAGPKAFTPPVMKEPDAAPTAWFLEDPKHRRWCTFTTRKAAEAFGKALGEFALSDTPGVAWIRIEGGKLDSVTVQIQSEDAFTEDRYFFDPSLHVAELRRTGLYVNDRRGTYVLKPNAAGKLAPTPQTVALLKRVDTLGYETYFVHWDTYSRLSEMPFAKMIAFDAAKVTVKPGCTPTPKGG